MKTRIQKALADAGVVSRRGAEEMILEGRITVNRKLVVKLPCFIEPGDEVRVDGQPVRLSSGRHVYFLLNKPSNVLSVPREFDPRPSAQDLVPSGSRRLHCIGALNAPDTGLVILTDDGELAQRLGHPSSGLTKTYVLDVDGRIEGPQIESLKQGVYFGRERTEGAKIKVLSRSAERTQLGITLSEGKTNEVRHVLSHVGCKVRRLKRNGIGALSDKGLKIGMFRPLRPDEVEKLRQTPAKTGVGFKSVYKSQGTRTGSKQRDHSYGRRTEVSGD